MKSVCHVQVMDVERAADHFPIARFVSLHVPFASQQFTHPTADTALCVVCCSLYGAEFVPAP